MIKGANSQLLFCGPIPVCNTLDSEARGFSKSPVGVNKTDSNKGRVLCWWLI